MDGGIRRGSDIAKAMCLGARAVLIGRAYAYGLGAAGEAGVTRAIEILRDGPGAYDGATRLRIGYRIESVLRGCSRQLGFAADRSSPIVTLRPSESHRHVQRRRNHVCGNSTRGSTILPGFMRLSGSKACLIARIASSPAPCSSSRYFIRPVPMPCSPVQVPPISSARRIIFSSTTFASASSAGSQDRE